MEIVCMENSTNRAYRLCKQDMSELPTIGSYDQLPTALAQGKLRDLQKFLWPLELSVTETFYVLQNWSTEHSKSIGLPKGKPLQTEPKCLCSDRVSLNDF
jgi:hypothetical protein